MKQTLEKGAAMMPGRNVPAESVLLRRIGSTTYEVTVHFSKTSKEALDDKICRLIEREVEKNA